jgi:hypothetical protein
VHRHDGSGTLDARAVVSGGVVTEVWIDTKGKGIAISARSTRRQRVRRADTNGIAR